MATDADTGDTIAYTILPQGNSNAVFVVDSSGAITLQKKLDYESVRKYSLIVEASDGTNKDTASVTVIVENVDDRTIAELIRTTSPMTAVLFSGQDRNSFEVVKDPNSTAPTIGIINQSQAGTTAGILIAAERPFYVPTVGGQRMPIGAWYGVNLKAGSGDDVADVDLAAGLSFSFLPKKTTNRLLAGESTGLMGSARFLLGVLYGEVATLGPKNETESLQVGGSYPLGESLPLHKNKEFSFTAGIGFSF